MKYARPGRGGLHTLQCAAQSGGGRVGQERGEPPRPRYGQRFAPPGGWGCVATVGGALRLTTSSLRSDGVRLGSHP